MSLSLMFKKMHDRFVKRIPAIVLSLVFSGVLFLTASLLIVMPAFANDYNKETLVGVDFSGRDLTDSSFTKAVLRNSNLSNTKLAGVSLFGATLERVNLEGADLRGATLDTARFLKANLTNAVLEGAFAFNAKFDGSTIDGADFTDVLLRQDMQKALCKIATGINPVTGRETKETLYCD